jgi:acyl-CoA synthetase (AMP-forming)/AMP-acid ligase II
LQPKLDAADLSAWRISGYGGAIMPQTTVEQIARRLPNLKLMNCYGATETTSPATMMPPPHAISRRDSVGLPAPCAEILVMDEDGREVPPGADGEIWIGGPMVVKGYWENEAATAREFVGGYWRSGDLGAKDAAGFVRIVDRVKDVINRGGYKIHASEIENLILKHEALLEAAVIPVPCPVLGERVHAVVVLKEDAGEVEGAVLAKLVRGQVADYKVPETWSVRRTPLPRNANGKVLKRVLRDEAGRG